MDTETDLNPYLQLLARQKDQLRKAKSRQGQRPRDRPPRDIEYATFMMNRMSMISSAATESHSHLHTSFIAPAYSPSVTPIADLKPITIDDLLLETHHRGRYIALRSITPPNRMTALMVVAEDEDHEVVPLQLYYKEEEEVREATKIINTGTVLFVKEPYFKLMADGRCGLRVDHLSDVVWPEKTNAMLPLAWRTRISDTEQSADALKLEGNGHIKAKRYWDAISSYTTALEHSGCDQAKIIRRNRSLAFLKTKQFDAALLDTGFPDFQGEPSDKAFFRAAEALYNLMRYKECLAVLISLQHAFPGDESGEAALTRVRSRVAEQENGSFQFHRFQATAKKLRPPQLDFATYDKPVEIRQAGSKGRGLFTTLPVKAGDLLLCEKAFCHAYASQDESKGQQGISKTSLLMNLETGRGFMGAQADLLGMLVRKLQANPSLASSFTTLFHGEYEAPTTSSVDGEPVVDTFLVERIISFNVFGTPLSSMKSHKEVLDQKSQDKKQHHSCGIWTRASYINHSCVSNVRRSFIGDMMIVRATRDLEPGSELTFWYHVPGGERFDETKKSLKNWNFTCNCAICTDAKATSAATLRTRANIQKKLMVKFEALPRRNSEARVIEDLLKDLNETYQQPAAEVPRLLVWDPQLALTRFYASKHDPKRTLQSVVKVLVSLGFKLDGCDASSQRFQVKTWGLMQDLLVEAFLHARSSFLGVGSPEKANQAREYAKLAYKMVVGEDETYSANYE